MEARRRGGALEVGAPLYRGAEAVVWEARFASRDALVKERESKPYRHPLLDERLRARRTVREARALAAAHEAGVAAPALLYVDPVDKVVIVERIPGPTLAEVIEEDPDSAERLVERLGEHVARLHLGGVVHGDLTTSNVVVHDGEVYIIDFGLAELTRDERERAVDLHLFLRSLESTHPEHVERMMQAFLRGYSAVAGKAAAERLVKLVREIRLMGRYREERRTVWGAGSLENGPLRNQ